MAASQDIDLPQGMRQQILSSELNTVLTKLEDSLIDIFKRVEEQLLMQADACVSSRQRQILMDAYVKLGKKQTEIETQFKKVFRELLDDALGKSDDPKTLPSLDDWSELTLVDEKDIEEDVMVTNLSDRIKTSVESELRDLNARMNYLLGLQGVDEARNPLRPEQFCRALGKACAELDADHNVRIEIMRAFETSLSRELGSVYRDLNTRLISHNVLPVIRLRNLPKQGFAPPRRPRTDEDSDRLDAIEQKIENTFSMFDALQNLVANSSIYRSQAIEQASTTRSRHGLFNAIQDLRQAQSYQLDVPAIDTPLADLDNAAIALQTQDASRPGGKNLILDNREQLTAAAANQLDRITIDIVAMMFDQILADEKVSDDIKTQIGRLQFPILKVALNDPTFFASRSHPARRLVDRIASCAVGYENTPLAVSAFWRKSDALLRRFLQPVMRIVKPSIVPCLSVLRSF